MLFGNYAIMMEINTSNAHPLLQSISTSHKVINSRGERMKKKKNCLCTWRFRKLYIKFYYLFCFHSVCAVYVRGNGKAHEKCVYNILLDEILVFVNFKPFIIHATNLVYMSEWEFRKFFAVNFVLT